ncbi:hypothetical protein J7T55_010265 [Diaporthe amygdali]|uniref:uncharacterized protein n=1 Tax=Phomopsis amygdali TaxID=1214568 RepID=UPI0022FE21AD|nr:uncharacterized protein J7T55_010265 [Diaporthe amygdali]KAJ0107660.1 hypothetical protein J7T55_010265 [Diaporthe amygdali]
MELATSEPMGTQAPAARTQYPGRTRSFSTEAQWATQQPMIKKLYVDEGRTLQEVMDTMKRDFGFDATLRLRNGQLVSQERLATYLRRREEGRARANKPPLIKAVRSPDSVYVPEAVFFQVRTYIHGQWKGIVTSGEQLDTLREERPANGEWNALAHGVRYALEQKRLNDALVLMRRAPVILTNLIERQPVNMLQVLFMSLSYFTFGGHLERPETDQLLIVVKHLIKYAAVFATQDKGLPGNHPLRQLLTMLTHVDENDLHQLVMEAWRVNCQSWDVLMDRPRSTHAIASWIAHGEFAGFNAMPSNLGNIIELTLNNNAVIYGEYHRRTTHTLQMYSMYLTYKDRANGRDPYFNKEIVAVFEDLVRRGPQGLLKADALSWLARACRARGEREQSERYMRDLIEFLLEDAVHRESLARGFMNDLETWFVEWGEKQKAAELATWREQELGAEVTA